MLEALNEKARARIETPSGETKEIEIKRVVKQGTVYAPQLCCNSTTEVNRIGKTPLTVITPSVMTNAMIYVDDISGAGGLEMIKIIGENLKEMEQKRKFEFNLEKTKYMKIKTGKRTNKST